MENNKEQITNVIATTGTVGVFMTLDIVGKAFMTASDAGKFVKLVGNIVAGAGALCLTLGLRPQITAGAEKVVDAVLCVPDLIEIHHDEPEVGSAKKDEA